MAGRSEALQSFVDAALTAFDQFARAPESRRSIRRIFSALEVPGPQRSGPGSRLPVCAQLDAALAVETEYGSLRRLIDRFKAIEPLLEWRRRSNNDGSESVNFFEGHANAMIIGPGGLEDRRDLWIGVTLMAPNVRYPDHDHAPDEVYLVLSEGEFRQGQGAWFSPGVGGSFYNEPGIRHAMRSVDAPLFAFWALLVAYPAQ
ncbi:dimethylsulfoniopropionate lyase [Sinorhizobium terangae]|uniref:dimethylsulfoniopropionate lyase n=1 Tax=Sinorhizobium terangae TaxID=110322 RepID=UPI0024B25C31|nr:dimethylsulfoniopropionate lyase [Sinorhizobium terangae]WFU47569.1 dimethylsulfoniopropionate lyase [Sinorhizobium terangae]